MPMIRLFTFALSLLLIASCTYVQKIKDGPTAFDRKQYAVAIPMLKKEYQKGKQRTEKAKMAFLIGQSFDQLHQSDNATDWYKTAYDNGYGIDALKEYAYSLKKTERYKEAQTAFKELGIEIGSPYEYRKEINNCKVAATWKDSSKKSNYETEVAAWSSVNYDYAPTPFENGQLVFSSDRSASTGEETYNWTGNRFSDVFIADKTTNMVESFPAPINTNFNEGTATFNADFTEMIFTRCFSEEKLADQYCKLMMSTKEDESWSTPIVLNFIKEDVQYGHPSLSAEGDKLYFSSNDPDGWGGRDIWVATRTPEGWSEPKLLSRSINTVGNESFPFIDADTLYFSSDNHTGMGGLDIFKTYQVDDENWAPVLNLKAPINSGADDFGYMIDYTAKLEGDELQKGYFTSARMDGKGMDDIYEFKKLLPPPPPPVDTAAPPPPPIVYKMILKGYVVEKIFQDPNNNTSKVLGRKPLPNSKVDINFGGKKESFTIGEDGQFSLELDENTDYSFFATNSGYLSKSERFSTRGIGKDPNNPIQEFEVEIELDKIFENREIVLENIYYDYDQSFIREDAKPSLNKLATILLQNPTIKIELNSHTDCRGNPAYNQSLSQRRAEAAVEYLISQGIANDRIAPVGYGENAPAVDCACQRCSEDEHQINRRTSFRIVGQ